MPELADTQFAFHDINPKNLDMVYQLCPKDIDARTSCRPRSPRRTDRRRALADADYVFNCTRIGGLEAFQTDIDIPLKYGVDQCVGDTLCAGGIMYGQRNIPRCSISARTSARSPSPARCSQLLQSRWR